MKFSRNSFYIFTSQIIVLIFSFISSILIARVLGPSGKGTLSLLILIPTLLTVLSTLGLEISSIYFIGKKKYSADEITSTLYTFAIIVSPILIIIFFIIFILFPNILPSINSKLLLFTLFTIPFILISGFSTSIITTEYKFLKVSIIPVMQTGLYFLFLIPFVVLINLNIVGGILAYLLSFLFSACLSVLYVKQIVNFNFRFKYNVFKDLIKFGLKSYLAIILQQFNLRFDMFLVNLFLGIKFVGYYSVSVVAAEIVWYISRSTGRVLFPIVSKTEVDEANRVTPKTCRHTLFLTTICAIILFLISSPLIIFLYGKRFSPAIIPLWLLLPGIIFYSIPLVLSGDLTGRGKPIIASIAGGVSFSLSVLLDILFIPKWGVAGASFVSTISYLVYAIIMLASFIKISGVGVLETLIIKKADFLIYKEFLLNSFKKLSLVGQKK